MRAQRRSALFRSSRKSSSDSFFPSLLCALNVIVRASVSARYAFPSDQILEGLVPFSASQDFAYFAPAAVPQAESTALLTELLSTASTTARSPDPRPGPVTK